MGSKYLRFFTTPTSLLTLMKVLGNPTSGKQVLPHLLFGANNISPTKVEYGMFAAKAAALRTLDLSRQVGAAIFSRNGEIISMGSNEVPKATGGTYWCDDEDELDDRDYVRKCDANDKLKRERLAEILKIIGIENVDMLLDNEELKKSQFMDALEYGRIIHAEMSAITDAARLGLSISGATLYCTTFPCHLCAKHIISAGVHRVVFWSLTPKAWHQTFMQTPGLIEGADRGRYKPFPAVRFDHFHGISPRRYRELFERKRRKDNSGNFIEWNTDNVPRPIVDLKFPFYMRLEEEVLSQVSTYVKSLNMTIDDLDPPPG